MRAALYPSGYTEVWDDCKLCHGNAEILEADLIILVLSGEINDYLDC